MEINLNIQRIIERQARLINFPAPAISTCSLLPLMVCRINSGNNTYRCLLRPDLLFGVKICTFSISGLFICKFRNRLKGRVLLRNTPTLSIVKKGIKAKFRCIPIVKQAFTVQEFVQENIGHVVSTISLSRYTVLGNYRWNYRTKQGANGAFWSEGLKCVNFYKTSLCGGN